MEPLKTNWPSLEIRRFRPRGPAPIAILCCLALIPQRLAGQDASSASKNKLTVRGTVLNEVTKQAIPGALVRTADNRYATLTDDRGRFELRLVFPQPTSTGSSQR